MTQRSELYLVEQEINEAIRAYRSPSEESPRVAEARNEDILERLAGLLIRAHDIMRGPIEYWKEGQEEPTDPDDLKMARLGWKEAAEAFADELAQFYAKHYKLPEDYMIKEGSE